MKWGVIGILEAPWDEVEELQNGLISTAGISWGVRLFEDREDARQFAVGLQGLWNRIGKEEDDLQLIDELRDTDPGAYRAIFQQSTHVGWELRYQLLPFSEEFEGPHKESVAVSISPVRLDEEEEEEHIAPPSLSGLLVGTEDENYNAIGCFVTVGEAPDGWYHSMMVDIDDLTTEESTDGVNVDEGPFITALAALAAGVGDAVRWMETEMGDEFDYERPTEAEMIDYLNHRHHGWDQ